MSSSSSSGSSGSGAAAAEGFVCCLCSPCVCLRLGVLSAAGFTERLITLCVGESSGGQWVCKSVSDLSPDHPPLALVWPVKNARRLAGAGTVRVQAVV